MRSSNKERGDFIARASPGPCSKKKKEKLPWEWAPSSPLLCGSPRGLQIAEAGRFLWETSRTTRSRSSGSTYMEQSTWLSYLLIISSWEVRVIVSCVWSMRGLALWGNESASSCRAHLRLFDSRLTHLWSINLQRRRQEHTMTEKTVSSASGVGKAGQLCVSQWN